MLNGYGLLWLNADNGIGNRTHSDPFELSALCTLVMSFWRIIMMSSVGLEFLGILNGSFCSCNVLILFKCVLEKLIIRNRFG